MAIATVNMLNRPLEEQIQDLRQTDHYREIQDKLQAEREQKGLWVKGKDKAGETDYYMDVTKLSAKSFFTTVRTHEGVVRVPMVIKMIMGQKINLRDRIENLMEMYMKEVIKSTSHNLMMSRIAGMKMAAAAFILAQLGVPPEELRKLRKKALDDAVSENVALMEENLYNSELLEIVGGSSGARLKAERSVLDEIQKQILTQAKRLNIDDYYTKEKILEMRVNAAKNIYYKFVEEEQTIQYELDYYLNEA
ncbi:hypothetical protein NO2_1191 [Candidatus Termititenax persephonae]|uniref:Uncharacterized protein n=1 Tax=Candidatus Termititenax persephonae TaxID=2218525 RepID=A0A388TIQ7_9BACT|nr:hypothetical protein NO2_1191 [Candidatus Termititenax persephonae]